MNGVIAMPREKYYWEAESDFEAVCRAKAVEKDPKRMEKVKAIAKKRLAESKASLAAMQARCDMGEGKDP